MRLAFVWPAPALRLPSRPAGGGFGAWPRLLGERAASFTADLSETSDAYVLKASLPGVPAADIDVEATPEGVSVSGEYRREASAEGASYVRRERSRGRFVRSFAVPQRIKPELVEATHADGVLTVVMPKADRPAARRVPVGTATAQSPAEAGEFPGAHPG